MSKATVLVTGGAGFIGSNLCPQLLERGYRLRIYDNLYFPNRAALDDIMTAEGVTFIEGDVRYRDSVAEAMDGVDYVVHLAALSINKSIAAPEESISVNLNGSQNVFAAAAQARVRKLVFVSTASVYGEPDRLPMGEEDVLHPATPYGASKLASEHLLGFYEMQYGLPWMALRFFNVYGPGQQTKAYYTSVILSFIQRLAAGEAPVIQGSGEQSMDFIHVEDIVRAIIMAMESDQSGHVLNIGTGVSTSIADLANILVEALGSDVEPEFEPREVLVTRRAADITRAREVLAWEPKIDAVQGLRELALRLSREADGGIG